MAPGSDPTGPVTKNCHQRCDSITEDRVTGDESQAILLISEEGIHGVTVEVVAAVLVVVVVVIVAVVGVAGIVVVAGAVLTAAGVESKLVVTVVVVKEASKSMSLSRTARMALIYVNMMSVVGYGCDGYIQLSQCAESGEWYT